MRIFQHPNISPEFKCPICQQEDDKPVMLLPIPGTQDGNISQAAQVHKDCLRYWLIYCAENLIQ